MLQIHVTSWVPFAPVVASKHSEDAEVVMQNSLPVHNSPEGSGSGGDVPARIRYYARRTGARRRPSRTCSWARGGYLNDLAIRVIPLLINAAITGVGVDRGSGCLSVDVEASLPTQRINGVAAEFELLVGRRSAIVGIGRSAISQAAALHISAILSSEDIAGKIPKDSTVALICHCWLGVLSQLLTSSWVPFAPVVASRHNEVSPAGWILPAPEPVAE